MSSGASRHNEVSQARLQRDPEGWLLTHVEARPDWLTTQGDAAPPPPA